MRFTLSTAEIPGLINWFNGFIGFREIQKRTERVDAKLRDIGLVVPALNERYYFHSTYKKLVIRNRTYGRIDIADFNNNRVLSLIHAAAIAHHLTFSLRQHDLPVVPSAAAR